MTVENIKKYLKKIADFEDEISSLSVGGSNKESKEDRFVNTSVYHSSVDAVIICATQTEFEYFIAYVEGVNYINDPLDSSIYCKGFIRRNGRDVSIVLIVPTLMGIATAVINTAKAIMKFNPRFVFMFGIIAGIGKEINIGDIIIADQSINYNEVVETQYSDDSVRTKYMHNNISLSGKIKADVYIFSKSGIVEQLSDHELFKSKEVTVKIHFGLVVSGGQLQRNQSKIDQLSRDYHNIKGLDMETYGVYYAACNTLGLNSPEFISIKSVSDFGGNRKEKIITDSDTRREIAFTNAALFLYEFLKSDYFRII